MKSFQKFSRRLLPVALALSLAAGAHAASLIVNINYSTAGPGAFLYRVSLINNSPNELVVVSLLNAPTSDSHITPSLTAPSGFLASYDGGSGVIDLLEDSSSFSIGGTFGEFTFVSAAAPNTAFTMFEATDSNGGTISGTTNLVPEPTSTGLIALALLPSILRRRRTA
jgi:hypothetical protein